MGLKLYYVHDFYCQLMIFSYNTASIYPGLQISMRKDCRKQMAWNLMSSLRKLFFYVFVVVCFDMNVLLMSTFHALH